MNDILKWFGDEAKRLIATGVIILVILILIFIMQVIINRFQKKHRSRRAITVAKLIQSIIRYTIVIIGFIAILGVWGVNVGPILAGAGIVGIAVGLGAQTLIRDLLAGFSIVFENYYDVDDVVEIKGFKGRVIEIGLRSTRVQGWRGDVKIFANGDITEVTNFSKNPSVGVVEIDLDYQENLHRVLGLLEEKIGSLREVFPQILEGPNVVGIINMGPNSQTIRITAKTISEEHYAVERGIYRFAKELFEANGIKGPYQRTVVYYDKDNRKL
ncbi:MAG: mechanosensitive ion channel family protein [Acholeplasmataceae bacterium]|jgi:small-conductance mechanosensitive channel|nr:mechanosensitive ion channel family protein [Acholeplasmataceae bacterium]